MSITFSRKVMNSLLFKTPWKGLSKSFSISDKKEPPGFSYQLLEKKINVENAAKLSYWSMYKIGH